MGDWVSRRGGEESLWRHYISDGFGDSSGLRPSEWRISLTKTSQLRKSYFKNLFTDRFLLTIKER